VDYSTFFRTVNPDRDQVDGIIKYVKSKNWKGVALIGAKEAYSVGSMFLTSFFLA